MAETQRRKSREARAEKEEQRRANRRHYTGGGVSESDSGC